MAFPQSQTVVHRPIHPSTRLGHVHYTVADLGRQIAFYRDILGFKVHWQKPDSAGLGAGREDLLRLTQTPGARRVRGTTGLYHTAFLVPSHAELAQLLKSIALSRTPIQGMSNHGTHYAIYLPDAEGNGIELAWDMPKNQWPKTFAEMLSNNRGLSAEEVFSALSDRDLTWNGLHPDTVVGHVHLHVSQLPETKRFYYEILGFGLPFDMADAPRQFADSAIFFAAGDYHHHIGTNIWQGAGAPTPPAGATGLRYFTVVVPDTTEVSEIVARLTSAGLPVDQTDAGVLFHDPAQNGILLTTQAV